MVSSRLRQIAVAAFLSAATILLSGCVSWKSCRVTSAPEHTDVELKYSGYGLFLGVCGFTTGGSYSYIFRLPGRKTEYRGDEVREISCKPDGFPYGGTLSILRDRKRVVVKLTQHGRKYPFELNGTYRYH